MQDLLGDTTEEAFAQSKPFFSSTMYFIYLFLANLIEIIKSTERLYNYAFTTFTTQSPVDFYRKTGPEVTTCSRIIVSADIMQQHCSAAALSSSHVTSADLNSTLHCALVLHACFLLPLPLSLHQPSQCNTLLLPAPLIALQWIQCCPPQQAPKSLLHCNGPQLRSSGVSGAGWGGNSLN